MMSRMLLNLLLLIGFTTVVAQETVEKNGEEEKSMKGSHRFTIALGHTNMANGRNVDGKKVWIVEPSWGLNYDYWIGKRWAIGLNSDMVIENFVVEQEDGEDLEREKPISLIGVGIFKPGKHFSFIAGGGVEFEKEENLGLTRIGIEYGAELPKSWEAGVAIVWDYKWSHYSSWSFEFSFSKILFRKK